MPETVMVRLSAIVFDDYVRNCYCFVDEVSGEALTNLMEQVSCLKVRKRGVRLVTVEMSPRAVEDFIFSSVMALDGLDQCDLGDKECRLAKRRIGRAMQAAIAAAG